MMFGVIFLSRRESQRPKFVDTRAQFSFNISKQGLGRISLFLEICKLWGHNRYEMASEWCKNFSIPTQFFQFVKLTQSSKIFEKAKKIVFELINFGFFPDFLKNFERSVFEKHPPETNAGHQIYMVKRDISILLPVTDLMLNKIRLLWKIQRE